jgi:hypothetical protein
MKRMIRAVLVTFMTTGVLMVSACQSPTSPDDTLDVDDFLEITVTPNPAIAAEATDGKTYRVVRGNNQPDDVLLFDWKTAFSLNLTLNGQADDDDVLTFPVDLTTVTIVVKQASGGIVTPPAAGETEHYSYLTQASANRFGGVNTSVSVGFEVWYDLPSLRKEALIAVSLSFSDADGTTFTKTYDVRVAP